MGICSHCVVVAEMSTKLPQFVEWFKKSKKVPNLSKFAETTMSKGRGEKGGACSRKRKPSLPTKKRIENPSRSSTISTTPTVVVPPEVSESNSTLHSRVSNKVNWRDIGAETFILAQ